MYMYYRLVLDISEPSTEGNGNNQNWPVKYQHGWLQHVEEHLPAAEGGGTNTLTNPTHLHRDLSHLAQLNIGLVDSDLRILRLMGHCELTRVQQFKIKPAWSIDSLWFLQTSSSSGPCPLRAMLRTGVLTGPKANVWIPSEEMIRFMTL